MIYKSKGFSLVEVLMTLLIMSLILVLALPIVTRKVSFKNSDGVVFTYASQSESTCPTDVITSTDGHCSRYEYTVPNGIHYVNLTLVAGGGGGGGAAGITYFIDNISPYSYSASGSYSERLVSSDIKKIKINLLTARGTSDNTNCTTTGAGSAAVYKTGNGGASSTAIVDYTIPSYLYNVYKNDSNDNPLLEYIIHDRYSSTNDNNKKALYFIKSSNDEYCEQTFNSKCKEVTGGINWFDLEKYYFVDMNRGIYSNIGDIKRVRYIINNTNAEDGDGPLLGANDGSCKSLIPREGTLNEYEPANDNNIVSSSQYCFKRHAGGQGSEFLRSGPILTDLEYKCVHGIDTKEHYLLGGEGGSVSDTIVSGQGISGCFYRTVCTPSGIDIQTIGNNSAINTDGASIQVSKKGYMSGAFEDYRLTGGGGSGGNVVRITGFKVEPGETYVIYVGKGGKGGAAGKDIETNQVANINNGEHGKKGSATLISKKETNGTETRLFAVMGGAEGVGGGLYTNAGVSQTRNAGFYNNTGGQINLDPLILSPVGNTNPGSNTLVDVYYQFLRERNLPYWAINYNNASAKSGVPSYSANIENQNYLKGFSDFNHPTTKGSSSGHLQYKNNVTVEDILYNNDDDGVYDGFYYRTFLKNYTIGHVGGLGGFSGFGGKAGCGGLFMGNSFGAIVNNNLSSYHFNDIYKNKFIIATASGNKAFNVNDYYDNCSNMTSDGQSATFVMPDPKNKTFGQAGAGGGGGGYSVDLGPGNGGDGQDGYVMIDWRK